MLKTIDSFHCALSLNSDRRCSKVSNHILRNEVKNKHRKMQPLVAFAQYHSADNRRSADYSPSIWGNTFLPYASDSVEESEDIAKHAQNLKDEIKKILTSATIVPSEKMELIDKIQRLGISYHFEKEIGEILQDVHTYFNSEDNLHKIALRFRLLRQQGYNASCDVFNLFKDHEGKFKKSLDKDLQGLLSLYEASHLRIHGEDVLAEALDFTTAKLESLAIHQSPSSAARTKHALKWPIHYGYPRVEARQYLASYEVLSSRDTLILEFAKIDFNRVQKLHQSELGNLSKWWNDLNLIQKMPFARDRLVESYFWALGVHPEPKYSLGRKILTKVTALIAVLDDIYDVYGTFEELEVFTKVVQRWDGGDIHMLQEDLRPCFEAILDVYREIEKDTDIEKKSNRAFYFKEVMKGHVRALFEEAKWFYHQHIPTVKEYMEVALITNGYWVLATTSFVGMGDIAPKDAFEWISGRPKILRASEVILRLLNDIRGHKHEQKRGHVASSVECYMKQYGVTEQETINKLQRQISDAWKDINQGILHPNDVNMPLLTRVLNLARVANLIYHEEDGFNNGNALESFIRSLFIEQVATGNLQMD